MTTILPPPKRNDYKLDRDYKKAYKEWKKVFNLAIKKYQCLTKVKGFKT